MPLYRVITFDEGNNRWQLVIRRGQVFCRRYNDTTMMPVNKEYLEKRWFFCPVRGWHVARTPTRMASLVYALATRILPHWEFHVHPYYVSEVCIFVKDLWNTPTLVNQWDLRTVANKMYRAMDLESIQEDLRYQNHVEKVAKKTKIALSIGRAVGFRCAAYVYSFL